MNERSGLRERMKAACPELLLAAARAAGADLLLAVVYDAEGARRSRLRNCPGRVEAEEKAPLHVVHPGAVGPVFI